MPPDNGGPYVAAAFFCEKVMHEADNVMSAIRIFDRMQVNTRSMQPGMPPPEHMPPLMLPVTAFILVRSGKAKGRKKLGLTVEAPSGLKVQRPPNFIHLEGGTHSATVVAEILLEVQDEGVYWFEIAVDGDFLTKLPLEVRYLPQS